MNGSPILIGGSGSSGTTLLRELINSHPDVYCGSELSLLNKRRLYEEPFSHHRDRMSEYLAEGILTSTGVSDALLPATTAESVRRELRFCETLVEYGVTAEELRALALDSGSLREFVDAFFGLVLKRAEKQRWAEKTPTNCYCIEQFLRLYPDGCYIHVVRDGRDVVPSLAKRGWSHSGALRRWMFDTATGLQFRGHPRYYELRYEELVREPAGALAQLLEFLGYRSMTNLVGSRQQAGVPQRGHHTTWTTSPTQTILPIAVKKWKSKDFPSKPHLEQLFRFTRFSVQSREALRLEDRLNGNELLAELGYDPEEDWDTKPRLSWSTLRFGIVREAVARGFGTQLPYFNMSLS